MRNTFSTKNIGTTYRPDFNIITFAQMLLLVFDGICDKPEKNYPNELARLNNTLE